MVVLISGFEIYKKIKKMIGNDSIRGDSSESSINSMFTTSEEEKIIFSCNSL